MATESWSTGFLPNRNSSRRRGRAARVVGLLLTLGALAVGQQAFVARGQTKPTGAATRASVRTTTQRSEVRLPPRATLSDEEYKKLAAELREAYAKPPAEWPKPTLDEGVEHRELGLLPPVEFPADNPYSKEKEVLGKTLFFDPRLSGSGQIACASCHEPDLAWADGREASFGHDRSQLKRNSPSIILAAYAKPLFWDGRAKDLEEQFRSPVESSIEMHGKVPDVERRLAAIPEYRQMFAAAFGDEAVTFERAAKAVATFERTIPKTAGRSQFDRFLKGQKAALSDSAVRGLHLFRTTARCLNCHNGPTFSDNQFHNVGLSYYGRKFEDLGRYVITDEPKDVGAFRTPTLRNVARTRPYMHNGLFDLEGVINIYNAGMPTLYPNEQQKDDPLFPTKDRLLKSLGLNAQDRADLKEFLEALSDPPFRGQLPKLPAEVASAVEEKK